MNNPYQDLLHLPHPVSTRHAPMKLIDRAAQFSPFAALSGYDAAVLETARITDSMAELDEAEKLLMGEQLTLAAASGAAVELTCFEPDAVKEGGAYRSLWGHIRRIDTAAQQVILREGARIFIPHLVSVRLTEDETPALE